jgi:putative ABC transport system permease protein
MTFATVVRRALLEHKGRAAVSLISVVLGVAVFLGVSASISAISAELDRIGGVQPNQSFVQLVPLGVYGARAPETAADPIRTLPGVVGVRTVSRLTVDAPLPGGGAHAVDVQGLPREFLDRLPMVTGRPPGASEAAVDAALARRLGIGPGQAIRLRTPSGERELAVAGVIRSPELRGSNFSFVESPQIAVDPALLRVLSGPLNTLAYAFVELEPGTDTARWVSDHEEALGPLQPEPNLFLTDSAEFFRQIERGITPVAATSLGVGAYLIFLTVARTVHDRRTVYGTMRAVGASRGQVVALVLAETAVLAAIGTALGVVFGLFLAEIAAQLGSGAFGIELNESTQFDVSTDRIVVAAIVGLLTPLAAAAVPAVRAARLDPAVAVRGTPDDRPPTARPAIVGALLLAAGSLVAARTPEESLARVAGLAAGLTGTALVVPFVARLVAAVVRPLWRTVLAGTGDLAAQRLARRPGRSAATAGLLATTLALVFMVATFAASARQPFVDLVGAHFPGDLSVHASTPAGIDPATVEHVRRHPAVRGATPVGFGRVRMLSTGGRVEWLRAVDPDTYFDFVDVPWLVGTDEDRARTLFAGGGHVLLASSIAERTGLEVGDRARIHGLAAPVDLTVAGIYAGLELGNSRAVVVSLADAQRHFGMSRPGQALIHLVPESAVPAFKSTVAGQSPGVVWSEENPQLRTTIVSDWERTWGLVYAMMTTTALIALLGLANTMVMEVLDRRHEIGVLRAVGAHRSEVRRLVSIEAVTMAVTTGLLAVAAGTLLGWVMLQGVQLDTGLPHPYVLPRTAIPVLLGLSLVVGFVASALPARRAASIDPAHVLRFS